MRDGVDIIDAQLYNTFALSYTCLKWGINDNTILFDRAVSQPYCSRAVSSLDLLIVLLKVISVVV